MGFRRTTELPLLAAILAIIAAAVALIPTDSSACSRVAPERFIVEEEDGSASIELGAPVPGIPEIQRARNVTEPSACATDSCADAASIWIPMEPPQGFGEDEVGYVVEWKGGQAPAGFGVPNYPLAGGVQILFTEKAGDPDVLDIELSIRAIDRAGNLGPAVTVQVIDSTPYGCGASTGRATALALPFLALLAMRRRGRLDPSRSS